MTLRQRSTAGFDAAWSAYYCALKGHLWRYTAYRSDTPPPPGCLCVRCGAVNK